MNQSNSIETIDKTNFTDEINKIENYFHEEINQRKMCRKKLIKYATVFDYIDNVLIVLSATSSGVTIISFRSVVKAPVSASKCKFYANFFLSNWNSQQITEHNKEQKEKA